jgi:C1A family cysteine protease
MGQLISGPRVFQYQAPPVVPQPKQATNFGNSQYAESAYGALFEPKAEVDDAYKFQFDFTLSFPPEHDIRNHQASPYPAIRNQGNTGACTAYAAVGAIECTSRRARIYPLWDLSPLYLYVETLTRGSAATTTVATVPLTKVATIDPIKPIGTLEDGTLEDAGSTIFAVLKTAIDVGVADSATWPGSTTPWNTPITVEAGLNATKFKVTRIGRLSQDIHKFKTALLAGFAIAFSFAVSQNGNEWMKSPENQYPSFVYPSSRGAQDLDKVVGAHAVVIVGYNDAMKLFIIRNSWGPLWGDHGHFFMTYNMMAQPFWTRDFYVVLKLDQFSS